MTKKLNLLFALALAVPAWAGDRATLEIFYATLGGSTWERSDNWLTASPLSDWHGVVAVDGRVVEIVLPDNGLNGYLPHDLSGLVKLAKLDLRWNEISGGIPQEFEAMSALQVLLLTGNRLTGQLPSAIGGLSALQGVELSYSALTGAIPAQLGNLSALEALGLHSNQLIGAIPPELSRASNLKRLVLNDNRLVGALPSEFARMRRLNHINIDGNPMSANELGGRLSNKRIDHQIDGAITGAHILDQTTHIVGDPEAEQFMRAVLRSLELYNGRVYFNATSLPPGVSATTVGALLVHGVNQELMNREEWVDSLLDFERALELYGRGGLQVPDGPITQTDLTTSTVSATSAASSYTPRGGSTLRSAERARISCRETKSGFNLNPSWEQRELVARTPCTTATFRTRLAMYISGSVSGPFFPHLGLYSSSARRVSC
ncbi:MAG: hypothetical protein OXH75_25470 [Acidobacteria bacterium]|nr:hypothetical protein [Acidobacteriota bacterium]